MTQSSATRDVDKIRDQLLSLEAKAKKMLSKVPERPQQLFHTAPHMRLVDAFAAEARADLSEIAQMLERLAGDGWVPLQQARVAKSQADDVIKARTLLKFRKQAFMTRMLEWASIMTPQELDERLDPSPWQLE